VVSTFTDSGQVRAPAASTSPPRPVGTNESTQWTLIGSEPCPGATLNPQEPAGNYTLTAGFAGDATHNPSTASVPFTVLLEETTLTCTGPTKAANGSPLTHSGVLKEDGFTPIAGRTVTFTIGSGGSAQSYLPASDSATLRFQFMTGRAFGLSSSGLVGISPTPDTGQVCTAGAASVAPPCVATISGLISAHTPVRPGRHRGAPGHVHGRGVGAGRPGRRARPAGHPDRSGPVLLPDHLRRGRAVT